jgi:hypothetical protein
LSSRANVLMSTASLSGVSTRRPHIAASTHLP